MSASFIPQEIQQRPTPLCKQDLELRRSCIICSDSHFAISSYYLEANGMQLLLVTRLRTLAIMGVSCVRPPKETITEDTWMYTYMAIRLAVNNYQIP